jgi:hypothetical protein
MRTAIALLVGVVIGACVDADYVEGVRCKTSTQCGRSLECEQGFCGGCPESGLLDDGTCGCPGDRIFDCRTFTSAPYCMEVCAARRSRCAVALLLADGELRTLDACDMLDEGSSDPCYRVVGDSSACMAATEIQITAGDLEVAGIVANCPPPDDERFDCPQI